MGLFATLAAAALGAIGMDYRSAGPASEIVINATAPRMAPWSMSRPLDPDYRPPRRSGARCACFTKRGPGRRHRAGPPYSRDGQRLHAARSSSIAKMQRRGGRAADLF